MLSSYLAKIFGFSSIEGTTVEEAENCFPVGELLIGVAPAFVHLAKARRPASVFSKKKASSGREDSC